MFTITTTSKGSLWTLETLEDIARLKNKNLVFEIFSLKCKTFGFCKNYKLFSYCCLEASYVLYTVRKTSWIKTEPVTRIYRYIVDLCSKPHKPDTAVPAVTSSVGMQVQIIFGTVWRSTHCPKGNRFSEIYV